jgi:ATP-binding protein involved in chromosome partitioning
MTSNIIQGPTPIKNPAIWNTEPLPNVKRVVAIASGKGGVGKSTTAVNLAQALNKMGKRVGLLDADIYGPSVPRMMALSGQPDIKNGKMVPLENHGIQCMSMGFITGDEAAVLRGPMISKTLTQLLRMSAWGTDSAPLDLLIVDMPPGTGDIHLSMAQLVPLSGAIIVTTPQEVALIDARKCVKMFGKVGVPVLGVIENMSGSIFGSGGGKKLANEFSVPLLGTIVMDETICRASDAGALYQGTNVPAYTAIAKALVG